MALETDLPVLKIGCGNVMMANRCPEHNCGDFCENLGHIGYGDTCQHNLNAVKARAAAYRDKCEKFYRLHESQTFEDLSKTQIVEISKNVGARDAVLELAGLTMEDLEEEDAS